MHREIETSIYKDGELISFGTIEITANGDSITHEIANEVISLIEQMLNDYRSN